MFVVVASCRGAPCVALALPQRAAAPPAAAAAATTSATSATRARSTMAHCNSSRGQPFLVVKGYHMGSAWFEEAFNQLRGASFFFEYEHCLRDLAPAGSHLAPATLTYSHLQRSCGPCQAKLRTTRCRACGRVPPPTGSKLHDEWRSGAAPADTEATHSAAGPCVATGVSFAALGALYTQHLLELRRLMPALPVLVHVRSNFVKHALSYLRMACPGEKNHATKQKARQALHVPPARLLLRVRSVAYAQQTVLRRAASLVEATGSGGGAVHRIVYEALQACSHCSCPAPSAPSAPSAPAAPGTPSLPLLHPLQPRTRHPSAGGPAGRAEASAAGRRSGPAVLLPLRRRRLLRGARHDGQGRLRRPACCVGQLWRARRRREAAAVPARDAARHAAEGLRPRGVRAGGGAAREATAEPGPRRAQRERRARDGTHRGPHAGLGGGGAGASRAARQRRDATRQEGAEPT